MYMDRYPYVYGSRSLSIGIAIPMYMDRDTYR